MSWRKIKKPKRKRKRRKMSGPIDLSTKTNYKFDYIIGVDECGWGSIAGPLVVCAAVLRKGHTDPGLKDSKRFTTRRARSRGAELAKSCALAYDSFSVFPDQILDLGPKKALERAQLMVVNSLLVDYPDALIVLDGKHLISGIDKRQQLALPSADARVPAVSAASIIGKVHRDLMMEGYAELYPEWNFHKNKGYPTRDHVAMVEAWGPTYIHRKNVRLVREALENKGWYNAEEGA